MDNILCIYHGNCADGFTAAWAVWKRFPDAEFFAGVHGDTPPDVTAKHVIMVDFSYKPEVLKEIAKKAKSVLILDHHISAIKEIKDFEDKDLFYDIQDNLTVEKGDFWENHLERTFAWLMNNNGQIKVYTVLDCDRSGAMITFQFFHPEKEVPEGVKHVQDRDLWKFKIPYTREYQSAVFSYPYEFEVWDKLMSRDTHGLIEEGVAIERKHNKDVKELVEVSKRKMIIGNHEVWVVNIPYTMASDACHSLIGLDGAEFGASYYDSSKGRFFSLRSEGDFDVSEIAKTYGGGGHKNAAGFRMKVGWEGEQAPEVSCTCRGEKNDE